MNDTPLVTVIALCYNHSPYVIECLDSVRKQTYGKIQLIIMDDFSSDNSVQVIQRWITTYNVNCQFIPHEKNVGICKSLNEALSHAKGEFVSIIATDDVWLENKIEDQMHHFKISPKTTGVVFSDAYRIDFKGELQNPQLVSQHIRSPQPMPEGNIFSTLLKGNIISAPTVLIRRSCYDKIGGYDERLCYEDYDMWLRISKHYKFVFSPMIGTKYRDLKTSLDKKMHTDLKNNIYESDFIIFKKWLDDPTLSKNDRQALKARMQLIAYILIERNSDHKISCLCYTLKKAPNTKLFVYLCLNLLKIPAATQTKIITYLKKYKLKPR